MRPREGAEIGPAADQNAVDVGIGRDVADGDGIGGDADISGAAVPTCGSGVRTGVARPRGGIAGARGRVGSDAGARPFGPGGPLGMGRRRREQR